MNEHKCSGKVTNDDGDKANLTHSNDRHPPSNIECAHSITNEAIGPTVSGGTSTSGTSISSVLNSALLSSQRARPLLSSNQSSMPCSVDYIERALAITDTSEMHWMVRNHGDRNRSAIGKRTR